MFYIEILRPAYLGEKDSEDSTVAEAIETIYSNAGRMITIHWNGFNIPLFGSSVSDIFYNAISILRSIEMKKKYFTENFLSPVFTTRWFFDINDDCVKITAEWITIANLESENITIDKLNEVSNIVEVGVQQFVDMWKNFLSVIKSDLLTVGYGYELSGFEFLKKL
jgi:hypothetical protein